MAGENTTEQVIVEFIADTSDYDSGVKKLEQLGKIDKQAGDILKQTNAQFAQRNKELAVTEVRFQNASKGSKAFTATLGDLDKKTKMVIEDFIHGFLEQAQVELAQARDELERFNKSEKTTADTAKTLKQELKETVLTLAQLKLEGKDNTAQYAALSQRAGELKDTIADVNAEIKTLGSDTATFDGLIDAATGVAAGFSVAQGAMALFGDESEETQKLLLKVNAAMAILQGLQQLQAITQKESAAAILLENTQRKISVIQTNLQTASESKNIIVKGAATAAQWALNAAMSANPIGAVITALLLLSTAIVYFTGEARKAAVAQAELNAALSSASDLLDAEVEGYRRAGERIISDMEANGAEQSEVLKFTQNNRKIIIEATEREIEKLRFAIRNADGADTKEANDRLLQLEELLEDQKLELYKGANEQRKAFRDEQWAEVQKRMEEEKAAAEKAHAAELKRIEDEKKARRESLEQQRAEFETQQLNISETSDEWKKLQLEIEKINTSIELIEATGNKAALALAKLADETRKLMLATVEQSETEFTDAVELGGQKRIEITSKNLNINKQLTIDAKNAEVAAFEEAEKKKQAALQKTIEIGLQTAQQVVSILQEIGDRRTEQQLNELTRQKEMYQTLRKEGKITEKEERDRLATIERAEKRAKREQAQRAKSAAIFEAVINTALAVTRAIPNPVLMALAGALGAINIALIASRPIPQFFSGKKAGNKYEGPATMSEHGAEIIERNGRMYIEPRKTLTWVGRDDKIYTASETRRILDRATTMNNHDAIINANRNDSGAFNNHSIDYHRLGREIAQNVPKIGLNVDENGFKTWVQIGQARTEYLNRKTKL